MKVTYLEVTFRRGRPVAAYLYLPRQQGDKSRRTLKLDPGIVVDFNDRDAPIGIEITAPGAMTVERLGKVLADLNLPPLDPAEWAPLALAAA